ncbi:MAG: roadblock/LC7 domain-containing protein [Actinobacteria bacterium]|nr:roadblock/LC7 domain-containing protein [Actinomycetota bacterium]
MSMNEKDFAELIASFLKGDDWKERKESPEEKEAPGKGKSRKQAVNEHKTILESLIDRAETPGVLLGTHGKERASVAKTTVGVETAVLNAEESLSDGASSGGAVLDNDLATEAQGLTEIVEHIADELGDVTAVILSGDGLPIASAGRGDPGALAARIPELLRSCREMGERLGSGRLSFVTFETTEAIIFVAPAAQGLVLAVSAASDIGVGLLRWNVKRCVELLEFLSRNP